MSTTVSMPQLGETVTEGTILRWAKQVGDTVAVDEVLVEISTDKVDTEVPSPAGGTVLEILVEEGATVEVGTAMAVIGTAGAAPASAPAPQPTAPAPEPSEPSEPSEPEPAAAEEPAPSEPTPAESPAPAASQASSSDSAAVSERLLSPVVRKLVRENDLDIDQITGSGQGGRITRKDVESHIESGGAKPAETPAAAPEPASEPTAAPAAAPSDAPPAAEPALTPAPAPAASTAQSEVVELDRLRVRIGQNMIKSKQTAAHVWTSMEVDYERVERVRTRHKEAFKAAEGSSLTYLPFIARATIDALGEFPVVNSEFHLEERQAIFHKTVNLGIAIDLDQKGL
ncbi:MAG: 2-oxo acid dehydrogenase subunit E2, partial [Acidimicrobiia bacterium]